MIMADNFPKTVTDAQAGILIVHQLNMLFCADQREDPDDRGCCADCCAPCGVIRDLLDAGTLRDAIADAPPHLADSWVNLDENWLRRQWRCRDNPPCERGGDEPACAR